MSMDTSGNVRVAPLYEKTSVRGNRCFCGRLGQARIMLFRDEDSDGSDPKWSFCLQSGDNKAVQKPVERS